MWAEEETESENAKTINTKSAQRDVLRNPYVWVLAAASAFMYISRYAINGWGVLYLQEVKGFDLALATQIISINALLGIVGIASYAAAGLQDIASGVLIDANKVLISVEGENPIYRYDFTQALWFWIIAATLSVLLVCVVWNKSRKNNL